MNGNYFWVAVLMQGPRLLLFEAIVFLFFRIACGGRPAPRIKAVHVLELIQTGTGMQVLEVGMKFLDSGCHCEESALLCSRILLHRITLI